VRASGSPDGVGGGRRGSAGVGAAASEARACADGCCGVAGLEGYAPKLRKARIDEQALALMGRQDLSSLDLPLGDAVKIWKGLVDRGVAAAGRAPPALDAAATDPAAVQAAFTSEWQAPRHTTHGRCWRRLTAPVPFCTVEVTEGASPTAVLPVAACLRCCLPLRRL